MPRRARWALLGGAILPATALIVWVIASSTGAIDSPRLPAPWSVVSEAFDLTGGGVLVDHVVVSLERLLTGFAFGSATGLVLGALVRRSRRIRILLEPTITALRAVPSVAWLPVALVFLGIGEPPTTAVVAIGATFPMFATVAAAGTGSIATGLRLALAQSWLTLIAAELLTSSTGIGFLLIESSGHGRLDRTMVVIVVLAALSKTGDALLASLERHVRNDAATLGRERTPDHL